MDVEEEAPRPQETCGIEIKATAKPPSPPEGLFLDKSTGWAHFGPFVRFKGNYWLIQPTSGPPLLWDAGQSQSHGRKVSKGRVKSRWLGALASPERRAPTQAPASRGELQLRAP